MKRDKMRCLAWIITGFGLACLVLTIPLVSAYNAQIRAERAASSLNWHLQYASPIGGLTVGLILTAFGILLLAIRRPSNAEPPQPAAQITARADDPPQARAFTIPPWERHRP